MAKFNYISTMRTNCGEPCGQAACCDLLPCFQDPLTGAIDGEFEVTAAGFASVATSCLECDKLDGTYLIPAGYDPLACKITGQIRLPDCTKVYISNYDQYFFYNLFLEITASFVRLSINQAGNASGNIGIYRYELGPDAFKLLCDGSTIPVPIVGNNSGTCLYPPSLSLRYLR